jgi:hypothetical protein
MSLLKKIFSFATLLLIVSISLSGIAAWYSIQGLTAIFAAAVIPIMIMGGSLEFAKVLTTVWLHRYWRRAEWKIKTYLTIGVIGLALLTSMGVFGFLSKAHSDQALVGADVQAKISVYDTKIQTAQTTISGDRKALQQMDAAVDQVMSRSTDVRGAERSAAIHKSQAKERARLNKEIEDNQTQVGALNEQSAPIRAQIRKVEADVGPIKYIAALIYGDNPSADLLERAVRWVIILIVFVFDPLALTLVIAATTTYEWMEQDAKAEKILADAAEKTSIVTEPETQQEEQEDDTSTEPDNIDLDGEVREDIYEEHPPVTDETSILLEPIESEADEEPEALIPETVSDHSEVITTEGVTFNQIGEDYVMFDGKSIHKQALAALRPELFTLLPDNTDDKTKFGGSFPRFATKGDIFVRTDVLPNRIYKFDAIRWMEISKDSSDSYLYDEEYIKYLVKKIETGEYDIDLLSDNEKAQIKSYLNKNNT